LRIFRWGLALILIGLIFGMACGGDDDKTIKTDDGSVNVSKDVPDGFPDDFPIPDGADSKGGYEGESQGVRGLIALWESDDDLEEVVSFYEDNLDGDWKSTSKTTTTGGGTFTAEKGDQAAFVILGESDGKTTIAVTVGDKSDFSGVGDDDSTPSASDGGDSGDGDSNDGDNGTGGNANAELPDEVDLNDDFPKDEVPLPDDARVTSSTSFSNSGIETFSVQLFVKSDDPGDVADGIKSDLEGKGWSQAFQTNDSGSVFSNYTRGDAATTTSQDSVTVFVEKSDVDGYVTVDVTVAKQSN
jgi:hypothetical protein